MAADKLRTVDCDEECVPVKPCRRCSPFPVRIVEDCEPVVVKIEQKHCEEIDVKVKNSPHVRQREGDCWHVQGCKDGEPVAVTTKEGDCLAVQGCKEGLPVKVEVTNPPPAGNTNEFVFNGTSWEPKLTPSKFVVATNLQESIPTAVWTPALGTRFRLMGFSLTSSLAGQFNLRDGFGGPILISLIFQAGIPYPTIDLGNGILSNTPNTPLVLEGPGPIAAISGLFWGQEQL